MPLTAFRVATPNHYYTMSVAQSMISPTGKRLIPRLQEELRMPRLVVDGTDEQLWRAARHLGISASMIPKAMTPRGRENFIDDYFEQEEIPAWRQAYLDHGHKREAEFVGRWIETRFGITPNKALYAHADEPRHLATPDGIHENGFSLAEFKTSTKPLPKTTPRNYVDQMQWQMHVMGAERCLLVWEQHEGFIPVDLPHTRWVERDEKRIGELVAVANALLFEIEMRRADG